MELEMKIVRHTLWHNDFRPKPMCRPTGSERSTYFRGFELLGFDFHERRARRCGWRVHLKKSTEFLQSKLQGNLPRVERCHLQRLFHEQVFCEYHQSLLSPRDVNQYENYGNMLCSLYCFVSVKCASRF